MSEDTKDEIKCEFCDSTVPTHLAEGSLCFKCVERRDRFAAAALSGLLARTDDYPPETNVRAAWEYADAMMEARKR